MNKKKLFKKARKTPKLVRTVPNYNRNIVGTKSKTSHLIHNVLACNTHFKDSRRDPNRDGFMYSPGDRKSTSGLVSN